LVFLLAMGFDMRIVPIGSTTHRRKALRKGFQPDCAFYIARAAEMQAKDPADDDPETMPPADLIIEVDVTSPSLPRFPIYAAFGVPEIWRFQDGRVWFYRLEQGEYIELRASLAFPPLTPEQATKFVENGQRLSALAWGNQILDWARRQ
jgi:Uma2 family endonuclease